MSVAGRLAQLMGRPIARLVRVKKTRRRGVHKRMRQGRSGQVREYVWPSMGLVAWLRWVALTLVRQAEKPHSVALGLAFGVWVCFVPIFGTHMALAFLLCFLFGGSYLAAFIGTFISNPWTLGPMWWAGYEVGRQLLQAPQVDIHDLLEGRIGLSMIWENAEELIRLVFWPALLGGLLIGGVLAIVCYLIVFRQVRNWRQRRAERLLAQRDAQRSGRQQVEVAG